MNKIFDERGFLTAEGKLMVNNGFTKELQQIMTTAKTVSDTLIISCILKSIVAECATNHCMSIQNNVKSNVQEQKPTLPVQMPPVHEAKIIPFRQKSSKDNIIVIADESDLPPIEN